MFDRGAAVVAHAAAWLVDLTREGEAMSDALTTASARGDLPEIRRISLGDLRAALAEGLNDFAAIPTQLVFLCILYPIIGLVAARSASDETLLPLLFPLVAGLSLMGPLLAVGIYELSRRREAGLPLSWLDAFRVLRSPSMPSIAALGAVLLAVFVVWLLAAKAIYVMTVGNAPLGSLGDLARHVQESPAAWQLVVFGNLVGLLFAAFVLALSVTSFPMLLDRDVGPVAAVRTSFRAVAANPVVMAAWGLIVVVALVVGSLPVFLGLAVVMPVLGHATWRLYRKVIV